MTDTIVTLGLYLVIPVCVTVVIVTIVLKNKLD